MTDENAGKGKAPADAKAAPGDKSAGKEEQPPCAPVLMNPGEWDDPPECTTISEFHKGETEGIGAEQEDPDLEDWLDHWKARHSQKVLSEYHQDGAPFLEELPNEPTEIETSEDDIPVEKPTVRPAKPVSDGVREVEPGPVRPAKIKLEPSSYAPPPFKPKTPKSEKPSKRQELKPTIERVIDVNTLEFLAYTVVRALFPRRVRYSLKREGVIDMDVILYDRDIILNTNRLVFEVPDLAIWRIVYAYKGKPVVELGRGVPNRIKIYKLRLLKIYLDLWFSKRRRTKEKRITEAKQRKKDEADEVHLPKSKKKPAHEEE